MSVLLALVFLFFPTVMKSILTRSIFAPSQNQSKQERFPSFPVCIFVSCTRPGLLTTFLTVSPDRAIGCFPVSMYAQCNVQFWRCSSLEQSPSINLLCFLLLLLFLCRKVVFHYRVDAWCVPLKLWFLSAGTPVVCHASEAELEPSPSRPAEGPNNPPQSDFIFSFLLYVHRHNANGSILREGMRNLFTQEILESAMKVIHPVFQSM